ncbi:MAG: sulfate transporter CysZ [Gammaproteobacteria bacterium]|nr:MAG: sulfate transporter CysZ [Gammaproteobacteria bacterium]
MPYSSQHSSSADIPKVKLSGAGYFFKGFALIRQKGLRRFVFIPLTINLLLFSVAFYFMFMQLDHYMVLLDNWLWDGFKWLSTLLWPFLVLTVLVLFSFLFSTFANWIAAPFNGLLAEKIEAVLTGHQLSGGSFSDVIKDIPRTLHREWRKLRYYLPRALGFFMLMLVLPIFGQIIWFLFTAWIMAIQYKDYPFDNHKIPFDEMRYKLQQHKGLSYSFGVSVAIFSMIPLVNLVVMPVAICGATALWVDNYRDDYLNNGTENR